jgi:hypothetical protein
MVRRGTDESDFVTLLNVSGEIKKNGEVGVPASDENKMLFHGSPARCSNLLLRYSSEEEKIKRG